MLSKNCRIMGDTATDRGDLSAQMKTIKRDGEVNIL